MGMFDPGPLVLLVLMIPWLIFQLGQDSGETEADDVERRDACGR